ncbi:MAG: helicase-exonuclease AddAB subunit AddA [Eubacterium sp.]|nr:helicase-exonuclease AddAB subunit AddA [Eubacterium sp.]
MSVKWTDRQQQVIDLHNRNLLVAAAAGSGKTAVLVERMIQMITRKEAPVDIDRLLVVTFTNAAAAQMRERIGAALEAALKADPDNVHLQTQVTLLHNAQISTIHSFGLHVIRNHFYQIDLDPAFRIGDEREIDMLKDDVLEKVMEAAYAKGDQTFLDFVKAYSNTKNDKNICEMILAFHSYADSYPWPLEWLEGCVELYQCDSVESFNQQPWVGELMAYVHELTVGFEERLFYAQRLALEPEGPQLFAETIEKDLAFLDALQKCESYSACYQLLTDMEFAQLSRKKQVCDTALRESVKSIRNDVKKQLEKLRDTYFSYAPAEQVQMLVDERPMMEVLIGLTRDFMERFAKAKDEKNIIDFGDIEHYTLKILVDEKTKLPTATAREYQERFCEIMIDEYQDSNYVQEALLTAVSRQQNGENNMFMVGDVKQSIYRFRLARPELFMDKYRRFQTEDADGGSQRIDLHHNFRSRPEILQFTNDVFFHIMEEDMGNIRYDDEAALYPGRDFEEPPKPTTFVPEVLAIVAENDIEDKIAHEARVVATRIRQMTDPMTADGYCPEYRDIVILVHAMKGWSDIFLKVFAEEGIPLISSSRSGYFSATEVQTVLQLLKVLNNPRQDIALAGVLKSPIGGMTATELAQIKAAFPELTFYEAVARWNALTGEDAAAIVKEKIADSEQLLQMHEKVTGFFAFVSRMREQIPDTPIHELIQRIYQETGYLDYVTALPGGERRRANLDMLVELAISYENTSYQGLFDFVRYIEKMLRMELDYGEAELVSEQENAVRMMTIHKSKGLEFPVVFVCGMGKEFNLMGLNNALIFHPKYGAGLRWLGKEKRVKKNALARQVFGLLERRELLGEEQRLLYVALTRAKEKLILTGIIKDKEKYNGFALHEREVLSFTERMDAKCFWDWVLPAIYRGNVSCNLQSMDSSYIEQGRTLQMISRTKQREQLLEALKQTDEEAFSQVDAMLRWTYPHAASTALKQKVSVSEIKHRFMEQQNLEDAVSLHKEQEVMPYIPRFADRIDEENAGALRGTAMHRYLECFDFAKMADVGVAEQLEAMSQSGRLSDDLRGRLNLKQIEQFLSTDEAKRMAAADIAGNLYREKPFVMSIPASQVWEGASEDDPVLVQGIVDVFWMEEDGITLLDYKTDAVSEPEELVRRYKVQLELYAGALSRVFDNCKVKDILIYSFKLNKMISME